jgi:hypothetical protein
MITYLRVPKTGSTALMHALRVRQMEGNIPFCGGHYRAASLMSDAEHAGHNHEWVTMIRDPLQTYLSYYHFLSRRVRNNVPVPLKDLPTLTESVDIIKSGVTAEEFLDRSVPNLLFTYFYAPLNPLMFTCVGRAEEMERSWQLLGAVTGIQPPCVLEVNVNPEHQMGELWQTTFSETEFRQKNLLDYEMYELGLERFSQLCQQYNV